jgi:hypothetical protein
LAKDKYKKQIFIRLLELFICKDMSELQPIVIPSASLLPKPNVTGWLGLLNHVFFHIYLALKIS